MKKIKLPNNKFVIVDDTDFPYLSQFNWYYGRDGYVVRHTYTNQRKKTKISMHREILKLGKNKDVDHVNGNILDNRRINLRICTKSENSCNQKKRKDNSSGYKGVSWHKHVQKWRVYITVNHKNIYLGYFTNKRIAAKIYDKAAKKYHGKFARLNFQR